VAGKPIYVTRVVDTMTDAPRPHVPRQLVRISKHQSLLKGACNTAHALPPSALRC